jgi:hypothetical protein
MAKEKKPAFQIILRPAEGDLREVIEGLIREQINEALLKNNAVVYNDISKEISNYVTGVIGNDANRSSKGLRTGIDSEGKSER